VHQYNINSTLTNIRDYGALHSITSIKDKFQETKYPVPRGYINMKPTIHVIIVLMIISVMFSVGLGSSESKVIVDVGEKTSIEVIAKTNNATIIANTLKQVI